MRAGETAINLVEQAYAAAAEHDLDRLAELFTPQCEFVDMTTGVTLIGRDALRREVSAAWQAFPDRHVTKARFLCDANSVAAEVELLGTHCGLFHGNEPTSREVVWRAAAFYTLTDDLSAIAREAFYYDVNALLTQLA